MTADSGVHMMTALGFFLLTHTPHRERLPVGKSRHVIACVDEVEGAAHDLAYETEILDDILDLPASAVYNRSESWF